MWRTDMLIGDWHRAKLQVSSGIILIKLVHVKENGNEIPPSEGPNEVLFQTPGVYNDNIWSVVKNKENCPYR